MDMTESVTSLMNEVAIYARSNRFEYITPEMVLMFLMKYDYFEEAFEECGGDTEELANDLKEYLNNYMGHIDVAAPELSAGTAYAFAYAEQTAVNSGCDAIEIRHILHGIWQLEESHAVYYMEKQDITEPELLSTMAAYIEESEFDDETDHENYHTKGKTSDIGNKKKKAKKEKDSKSNSIEQFVRYLNNSIDDVNPLIGREAELERTIQILCRKDKNNPLHIGEPGVGKTAITYGLVRLINEGKVPEPLIDSNVYELDLGSILAGTQYRGDFEKRLKKILSEIESQNNPIIYIDEIHNLAGAGAVGESSFDAGNMLKPYLANGKIRFIGATTFEEYKKYFEKNKSLVRRFQNVEIKEPSEAETVEILKGLKDNYEQFHGVIYDDEVLEYAVAMSAKHINERFLPDKAIDLIDEAGAYRKLHANNVSSSISTDESCSDVVRDDYEYNTKDNISALSDDGKIEDNVIINEVESVEEIKSYIKQSKEIQDISDNNNIRKVDKDVINIVLTKICRVPIETVKTDNVDGLATLEGRLKSKIFGQNEAISQVVNAVKFSRAGLLEEGKPLASLLFVGPTGVGKTEVARTLAQELGIKLVRFDMSEYGEKHTVAKLIGSPAGYVGYEEGGLLTEEIRKNPSCVLLLDEIEKAHHDIYNVLLQVMDYATLTDNQGRKADFRNVIVIMTSNAGANRIGKKSIGFTKESYDSSVVMDEVKNTFQPEFRNRLNRIVVFNGMDDDMAVRIVEKKMGELKSLLLKQNISMVVDDAAFTLIKKKGVSEEFGAREVDRVIRNEIKPMMVDDILFGGLKDGGELTITAEKGNFIVKISD